MKYKHYVTPTKPISDAQVRMIYALGRRAGMDNDLLHDKVRAMTGGCEHITSLTSQSACMVIDRMQREAGETPKTKAVPSDRATIAQRNLIRVLACELGWDAEGTRLRAFLEKRFGVSDVQFLTAARTSSVIEAMKAMKQGGRGDRRQSDG